MKNVESGSKELKYISTNFKGNYNSERTSDEWWYQPENSSDLVYEVVNSIFEKLINYEIATVTMGQVTDYISESFYPIDPATNLPITSGTWINRSGNVVAEGAADAAGQVLYDPADGWKVEWKEVNIASGTKDQADFDFEGWNGTVFLKAQEDFIGGNVIQTNKDATLTINDSDTHFEKPNVNVRLLDMGENSTEVTLMLGDKVSEYYPGTNTPQQTGLTPGEVIEELYNNIEFTKIVDKDGATTVGNSTDYSGEPGANTGWETSSEETFRLADLGTGSLTAQELQDLIAAAQQNGTGSVEKEYQYSEADGPVGKFTYTVTKTSVPGEPADFDDHQTQVTGTEVETYTLNVTYVPYPLGEDTADGRGANAHNATSPGAETNGSGNAMTLESSNEHVVNVIDGSLEITKELEFTAAPEAEKTFTFKVSRIDPDDATALDDLYDFEQDDSGARNESTQKQELTLTITIPAGGTSPATVTGTALTGLPRGVYRIEEDPASISQEYQFKSIADNGSDCTWEVAQDGKSMTVTIGKYDDNGTVKDVLEQDNLESQTIRGLLGKVVVTNEETDHETDLVLTKIDSTDATIYLQGAEFKIYEDEALTTAVQFYDNEAMTGNPVDTLVTGADGIFRAYGIPYTLDGKTVYYMKETKAPDGYMILTDVVKLSIDKDGKITFAYGYMSGTAWTAYVDSQTYSIASRMEAHIDQDDDTNDVLIKDPPLYSLPSTGGIGIYWSMLSGVLLMLLAALLYLRRQQTQGRF